MASSSPMAGVGATTSYGTVAESSKPPAARQPEEAAASPTSTRARNKAPRLDALDAPRWFASSMIVSYHFYTDELGAFAQWGSSWTQFFFALSGFLLAYAEMARPAETHPKLSQLQYLRQRLVAIYPTYLFALLCRALQVWRNASLLEWKVLPLHFIMAQAWLPICEYSTNTCAHQAWNGQAWFVSVLVLYWLLLRPLVRWVRCLSLAKGGPLGYVHVFVCGVIAARVFVLSAMTDAETGASPTAATKSLSLDVDRAPLILRYGACIGYTAYALCVVWVPYHNSDYYLAFHNGGLLPVMLLVLLGGAIGVDPIAKHVFRNRVFVAFGRISYSQYLLQATVWDALEELFTRGPTVYMFPVVITGVAYLSEHLVATPCTEWQRLRQKQGIKGLDDWAIESADRMLGSVGDIWGDGAAATRAQP